jgi:GDP-L-fucose synthase
MENYDGASQVNVGVGEDLTIKELAEIIAEEVGYAGTTRWDTSKPDGTPRKLIDESMIHDLGWKAETSLREGIRLAIADYRSRN